MRTTKKLAAVVGAAMALMTFAAQAQETWVSIADNGRGSFGLAVGMATREAAEITALGECGGNCAIKLSALARCGAFAYSDTGIASGYGVAATKQVAEQSAWSECNARVPANSCTVRSARCFE